jgi:hypothetical protein
MSKYVKQEPESEQVSSSYAQNFRKEGDTEQSVETITLPE